MQALFLALHRSQAFAVKLEQVARVFFRLRGGASALEANSRGTGSAVAGCHGDKLHQVKGNVFIAARADRHSRYFTHGFLRGNKNVGNVFHMAVWRGPAVRPLSMGVAREAGKMMIAKLQAWECRQAIESFEVSRAKPLTAEHAEERREHCRKPRCLCTVYVFLGALRVWLADKVLRFSDCKITKRAFTQAAPSRRASST